VKFICFFTLILGICSSSLAKCPQALELRPKYARGFSFIESDGNKFLKIGNSFYGHAELKNCEKYKKINSFNKIAAFSTSHLHFIELLKQEKRVKTFAQVKYIYSKVYKGKLFDLATPLNIEQIISQKIDLSFSLGYDQKQFDKISSLSQSINIPILEYKENLPLARSEWVKVFGFVLKTEKEAQLVFSQIERDYLSIKRRVSRLPKKKVLLGYFFNGRWEAPGPENNLVKLIEDAGGEYVLESQGRPYKIFLSLSDVIIKSSKVDFWIPHNNWASRKDISKFDPRYEIFLKKYKNKIYNNSKRINDQGSNDFWESGLVRSDLL